MIKQGNYIQKVIFNVFFLVFLHNRMTFSLNLMNNLGLSTLDNPLIPFFTKSQ